MKRRGTVRPDRPRAGPVRATGVLALVLVIGSGGCGDPGPRNPAGRPSPALAPVPDTQWVRLVTELSEPGGRFDTDNLISNETSYLHVLGPMDRLGVRGGAYVGVGPDQNFSYVALQRPELAFILDIRRDNLLHHLLLKALFHESERRVDYLALLFGRAVPERPGAAGEPPTEAAPPSPEARRDEGWRGAGPGEILASLAEAPGGPDSPEAREAWRRLRDRILTFGVPLSPEDLATIERFHTAFVTRGGALRFTSHGQPPRPYYPTLSQLLLETDLEGRPGSYLATEEAFAFVDALQEANRVIPVVGDLAGPSALRAIGAEIEARGSVVRVLYTSNVEYYLVRDRTFPRYASNLAALPIDGWSVLIRSVFPNAARHPHAVPGYYSTQTLVRMEDVHEALTQGGYAGYRDLVTRDAIPLVEEGGGAGSPGATPGPGPAAGRLRKP